MTNAKHHFKNDLNINSNGGFPMNILCSILKYLNENASTFLSVVRHIFNSFSSLSSPASPKLFPGHIEYLNLSNIKNGPIPCAADDLELTLNSNLIYNPQDHSDTLEFNFQIPEFNIISGNNFDQISIIEPVPSSLPNQNFYLPTSSTANISGNNLSNIGLGNSGIIGMGNNFASSKNMHHHHIMANFLPSSNANNSYVAPHQQQSKTQSSYINNFMLPTSTFEAEFNENGFDLPSALDDEFDNLNYKKRKLNYYENENSSNDKSSSNQEFWDVPEIESEEKDKILSSSTGSLSSSSSKDTELKKEIDINEVNLLFDNYLLANNSSFQGSAKPNFSSKFEIINDSPIPLNTNPNKKKKIKSEKQTVYKCIHCDAKFKVKGYLTRHMKKHNSSKAFVCPFYKNPDEESTTSTNTNNALSSGSSNEETETTTTTGTKCHPTGGFSRRDTFKTHLKALHFIYPPGTKSIDRNSISGRCAGCFKFFNNNNLWLTNHIEKNECPGSVLK